MNNLKLLKLFIREAISDLKRPKAIFLAGGPGSGKSTVIRLLGLSDFETVDPDKYYEQHLITNNISLDVASFEEEFFDIFKQMKAAKETDNKKEIARLQPKFDKLREMAALAGTGFAAGQRLAKERQSVLTSDKHNFIIDGTGGDYGVIKKQKINLEKDGYDTAMVFVDAPLEVAIQRNQARGAAGGRRLRDRTVEKSWNSAQKNIELYEQLFGDTFFHIDAEYLEGSIVEIKPLVNRFKSL